MALRYTLPVILTVFKPSRSVDVLASVCVAAVANTKCHVVRKMAILGGGGGRLRLAQVSRA